MKKESRKIVVKEHTLWTKTEVSILAYFIKHNNKPAKYREITRAYISSSYSHYQKSCEELVKRGYLVKGEDHTFTVRESMWLQVKRGTESMEKRLPYLDIYLKKLNKRKH